MAIKPKIGRLLFLLGEQLSKHTGWDIDLMTYIVYVWNNNSKGTWDWQGSIKIPEDTWDLIAVAIEKTKATAYAHTESTKKLAIAENKIDHIDKFMFVASFYLLVFRIRSMKVSYLTKPHSWSIIISHLYWSNHS